VKNRFLVHSALFFTAILYGGNYLIAKEIMPGIFHPFLIVFVRIGVGGAFFWLFALRSGNEKISESKDYLKLALCALLGVATNQMLFFKGLSMTSPINASLVMTTTPILVLLAARFILKEPFKWQKLLGVALGFLGAIVLVISSASYDNLGFGNWKGDVLVFINASSYGFYLVLVKSLIEKYKTITVMKWLFLFGFLFISPFSLSEVLAFHPSAIPSWAWWNLSYIIVGVTILAYLFNAWALNYASPTLVGVYIYLQPILATVFSLLLDKDQITMGKAIAGLLIFAGVYLVSIRR
jgi:drug/metabolite transporter (DMT)-like permease